MITLLRGNSYTEIVGADEHTLWRLRHQLVVPLDSWDKGSRFGHVFRTEDDGKIYGSLMHGNRVAAGLTSHVIRLMRHWGMPGYVRDIRQRPTPNLPLHCVSASWRDYQDVVHRALMAAHVGVVDAPPRSGKTLMAARAVDALALNTLYLAPSVPIVRQVYEVFVSIFGEEYVARLDGQAKPAEKDISKPFVIATAQSAVRQSREFFDTRDVLIIDEFHHSAADTYHKINDKAENIYFRFCFTGSHFRTADDHLAMEAVCSNVASKVSLGQLIYDGWLVPARICFSRTRAPALPSGLEWKDVYQQGIVEEEARNETVVKIATTLGIDNGIPTIVLVKRRQHANLLGDMIDESQVVKGGEGALTDARLKDFRKGKTPILIGTSVIGEGVDLPSAAALVYAGSGGGSVMQVQSYFRPLTKSEGKDVGLIYDFIDGHNPALVSLSGARMRSAEQYVGKVHRLG